MLAILPIRRQNRVPGCAGERRSTLGYGAGWRERGMLVGIERERGMLVGIERERGGCWLGWREREREGGVLAGLGRGVLAALGRLCCPHASPEPPAPAGTVPAAQPLPRPFPPSPL